MTFQVLVSRTFQGQFDKLEDAVKKRVRCALAELVVDPYKPRPKADIKVLENTNPQKYRLRVGDYRVVYVIEQKYVKVIEVFHRGKGY